MTTFQPATADLTAPKTGIVSRIKAWFRLDMEALGNATIAISGLYGAPISYVPLVNEITAEKHDAEAVA